MSLLKVHFENFSHFMETNTKGVVIGIYSVSGLLFAVSYFKIRPITKFGKPYDIPKHFITNRIVQNGTVKSVEPNQVAGAILRVDHKPPVNLLFASKKTLPVKIFGINLSGNGYSWLQSITVNQKIKFLPIERHADYAECQVQMLQDPALNSKPSIDLAEALISLGFARIKDSKKSNDIATTLTRNEQLKKYYDKLDKIQADAKRNRRGLWASVVPPPSWPFSVIKSRASKFIYNKILPARARLPKLVR